MSRLKSARGASTGTGAGPKSGAAKPTRGAAAKGAAKGAAAKPTKGGKPSPVSAARGRPGVLVQKPKSDVFVVLLGVALGAILFGSLTLVLVLNQYQFQLTPPG